MNLPDLKQNILDNKISNLYIFTGKELALQDIYIEKIKEVTNLASVRCNSLKEIYSKLGTRSLIPTKPKIFIIRDDIDYLKSEPSWKTLISKKLGKNIIILLYTDVEKTSKFFKFHDEYATQFDFMGVNVLANRLLAITKLPISYCNEIVNICGQNYGLIKNTLHNLYEFAFENDMSIQTAYLTARSRNFIQEKVGDIIFDFTNSVVLRNPVLSYDLYNKLKTTDEGTIKLLSVLYNSFRNILLVQSTEIKDRNTDVLGLSPAQIFVSSKNCNKYTLYELVTILKLIRKIEKGIKTGEVAEEFAMEYFLSQVF